MPGVWTGRDEVRLNRKMASAARKIVQIGNQSLIRLGALSSGSPAESEI